MGSMKRFIPLVAFLVLALPTMAFAAITVPWNRIQVGTISPVNAGDGVLVSASSTIGNGTAKGGLTVSGTATTTNLILSSAIGSAGCATLSALGLLSSTGVACGSGAGGTFPFTPTTYGNSTSSVIGFLQGLFSTASSTFNGPFRLPALTDGFVGVSGGLTYGISSSSPLNTGITGNAGTATALANGRTIAVTGDLTYTSGSFDGTGNVTGAGTLATVNSNVGSFTNANITVNGKGLITAASNGSASGSAYPFPLTGNATSTLTQFNGGASTTQLSAYKAFFGATATTTIDGTGNIVIPSGSGLTITGKSDGCATFASGVLNSTGSACGSGGGSSFPFTPTTFGGILANSTSTLLGFINGFYSNNQSFFGPAGDATTTTARVEISPSGAMPFYIGSAAAGPLFEIDGATGNNVGIGTTSPFAKLSTHLNPAQPYMQTAFAIASSTGTGTSTLFSIQANGSTTLALASTSPSAGFAVLNPGTTTPLFQANCNTQQNCGNGLVITSNKAGFGVTVALTTQSASDQITYKGKGNTNGFMTLGTNAIVFGNDTCSSCMTIGPSFVGASGLSNRTGTTPVYQWLYSGATALTANTESNSVQFAPFSVSNILAHSNGTIPLQRDFFIGTERHSNTTFSATNSIIDLATLGVEGPPITNLNGNVKITNAYGLLVGSSTPNIQFTATTTNTYAAAFFAALGATNNYAAIFNGGNSGFGTTSPYATLSIHANATDPVINNTLFAVGSSTASATSTLFTILNNGNVGIGSSSPFSALSVQGATAGTSTIQAISTAGNKGGRFILMDTNGTTCTEVTSNAGALSAKAITCP